MKLNVRTTVLSFDYRLKGRGREEDRREKHKVVFQLDSAASISSYTREEHELWALC